MNLTPASILLVVLPLAAHAQTTAQWHPNYSAGWKGGYCRFTIDENSPAYPSQLACCKGAYAGQNSGYCLSQLPAPPTTSPTTVGNLLDVWYPDYETAWTDAGCKDNGPLPNGRPTYSSQLACCKGAYGGQTSGKCVSQLANAPTTSPTAEGGADFFYPDYETAYPDAGCKNDLPLPFGPGGRPTYPSMLECCKNAYAGQTSGACLSQMDNPPTSSPTNSDYEVDFWYPDYESSSWADAGCKNDLPLPYTKGGRPEYATQLECCKGAYGGQASGACLSQLESPPTTSPTPVGGADFYYPDYDTAWTDAYCINTLPLPFSAGGRPTYDSMFECCKGSYSGQTSGKCLSMLDSPPTTSPTTAGGLDVWYPDYTKSYAVGECINDSPLPNGRATYPTQLACCKGNYGGQVSGHCLSQLATPPTTSPTTEELNVYYADRSKDYANGVCTNDRPVPSGETTYTSQNTCCSANYSSQQDSTCFCDIDPCYNCNCAGAATCSNLVCS